MQSNRFKSVPYRKNEVGTKCPFARYEPPSPAGFDKFCLNYCFTVLILALNNVIENCDMIIALLFPSIVHPFLVYICKVF